jgi:hypothetical protein
MRRLPLAIAAVALSAVAASAPAKAGPYHLIRWSDTGFCQIWDDGIPTQPVAGNFTIVSTTLPTFFDALHVKNGMLWTRECSL